MLGGRQAREEAVRERGLKLLEQWGGRAGQRGVREECRVVLDPCLSAGKMGMAMPFTEWGTGGETRFTAGGEHTQSKLPSGHLS